MSYSTFLESQNKSLGDSLHEWKEKCRQYEIIIKAKDSRIQELENALTEIATRVLRVPFRLGGAAQIVLSAEQMAGIAEKALRFPQRLQPDPHRTNQDRFPPQSQEHLPLDLRTEF